MDVVFTQEQEVEIRRIVVEIRDLVNEAIQALDKERLELPVEERGLHGSVNWASAECIGVDLTFVVDPHDMKYPITHEWTITIDEAAPDCKLPTAIYEWWDKENKKPPYDMEIRCEW